MTEKERLWLDRIVVMLQEISALEDDFRYVLKKHVAEREAVSPGFAQDVRTAIDLFITDQTDQSAKLAEALDRIADLLAKLAGVTWEVAP